MADPVAPVADPAPSTSPPAVDPAAPAAPVAAATADPAKTPPAATTTLTTPVVPEKYDFAAVKFPEGMVADTALIEAVTPVFKELGITQENASKLVEAHAKHLAQAEVKREADFAEWMKTTVTNYQAALRKEWGAEHDANVVVAQKGMARVFSAEAKKLLDETGLGNHPEFVKAFYQVGKMVSEDTPPPGGSPPNSGKSAAQVLYGSTTPSQNH